MSFIRPGSEPKWVDDADTQGLYVYGDGEQICYMPTTHEEFVEVVMRMLEQSGELPEETLADVFHAFAVRMNWEESDRDLSRNTTRSDARHDIVTAVSWLKDREDWEDEYEAVDEVWRKLEDTE